MEPDTKENVAEEKPKTVKETLLNVDYWKLRWAQRKVAFHSANVHKLLAVYNDRLLAGREHIKIFFPMCGKAVDMKWVYDLGHDVVGVDGSEIPIKEFFEESGLEYTVEPLTTITGNRYKTTDGRIQIFECDLFDFNKDLAGQFDAIWDRGALVSVNKDQQKRFASLLETLMAPGCRQLLCIKSFDDSNWPGPPHVVRENQVCDLYGDKCTVEKVCSVDSFEEQHKSWGITEQNEDLYLIIVK
ncbi:probable thiopurine S-methyltransferase [Gigantopelta aegis]|uniref:probable thiopurine S-methyltransferase n=1 Tax=Gigantopelta aegis TaxID=1735272 RepID=UPI001B889AF2|nr:probable thiopurine S-methyltransferase [Gigantopelta aegis]XP_041359877.1 probable thiopurine S-methyltransferase [Gigantopelta aegis]XP_041359878.1 probable thiopurine S-methyltransferase [Gigantopelta aegis]